MEQLIPITGYAKTYDELCNKTAMPGEYFNVFDQKPFVTYHKLGSEEIGDTMKTTDVIGWYKNKAELESNVTKPTEGEVYTTGECAPYTRWKAQYVNYVMTWVEDGEEQIKIVKKYKTGRDIFRAHRQPEEGIFYAIGTEPPYHVYGVVSSWEPVGTFLSYVADDMKQLLHKPTKSNPGEVAYLRGLYYLYNGEEWELIDIPEPIENVFKHIYEINGEKYKLREGSKSGTLEYYQPR